MLPPEAIPHRRPGIETEVDGDGIILLEKSNRPSMSLNQTASLVWLLCDGQLSIEEICWTLTLSFPEASKEVEKDVLKTLEMLFYRGVMSFNAPENYPQSHTYHDGTVSLFGEVLASRGWHLAKDGRIAGVAYSRRKPLVGVFQNFDLVTTSYVHDKVMLADYLRKHNLEHIAPETHTSLDAFLEKNENSRGLWFTKKAAIGRQLGVACHSNVKSIVHQITQEPGRYVIQRCIENIRQYQNQKCTFRVFMLVLSDGAMFVHENSLVKIQTEIYNPTSTAPNVQFLHRGSAASRCSSDRFPWYSSLYPNVIDSITSFAHVIESVILAVSTRRRFSILGLDYVFDQTGRSWLLEANHTPDLCAIGEDNEQILPIKYEVLGDMFSILLDGANTQGRFHQIR